jgi:hypothetical protein
MIRFKGTNSSFQLKIFRDEHPFQDSKAEAEYVERVKKRLMMAIEVQKLEIERAKLDISQLDNQAGSERC